MELVTAYCTFLGKIELTGCLHRITRRRDGESHAVQIVVVPPIAEGWRRDTGGFTAILGPATDNATITTARRRVEIDTHIVAAFEARWAPTRATQTNQPTVTCVSTHATVLYIICDTAELHPAPTAQFSDTTCVPTAGTCRIAGQMAGVLTTVFFTPTSIAASTQTHSISTNFTGPTLDAAPTAVLQVSVDVDAVEAVTGRAADVTGRARAHLPTGTDCVCARCLAATGSLTAPTVVRIRIQIDCA